MIKNILHSIFSTGFRLLTLSAILAGSLLSGATAGVGVQPVQAAPSASQWYDGMIQYTTVTNCASIIQGAPYQENGMGAYVGYMADINAGTPSPNMVYYAHVVLAGLGNPCSGGTRAYIDVGLPANTTFSINSTTKVYCFLDGAALATSQCPQIPLPSSYNPGMYAFLSSDAAHGGTWAIAQGHIFEMQIPLISSTALSSSLFSAKIWAIDGESNPWLNPTEGIYVFNTAPSVLYPSPSTINISTTTAHSMANLFTHGLGGTGWFDLGTSTAYGLIHESIAISAGGNAFLAYDDWGPTPSLSPNTLYHWRFSFNDSNGGHTVGADQTFTTLPDGLVTVGSGAAASCTTLAFTNALATAKQINFNCGASPVTITLPSAQAISSTLIINGGNLVTLSTGGSNAHFVVQGGAHLTLSKISLTGGHNTITCGGSIHVLANGQLTTNEVRFMGNSSNYGGGAVCLDASASADMTTSVFSSNQGRPGGAIENLGSLIVNGSAFNSNSSNSHGGAIENYGTATLSSSNFNQNTAQINGGAIDTTVNLSLNRDNFTANFAVFRGGAFYNYLGIVSVYDSGFINNRVNGYGGGIGIDGGTVNIYRSLVNGNAAGDHGGGLSINGTTLLEDVTIAGNTAANNGGGLDNTGSATLTNVTLVGNRAGIQGGNIFLGASASTSAVLKNTVISGGSPSNCDNAITSQGHNLENTNTCGLAAAGDLVNSNPRLWVLADRGGPTASMVPYPGSPLIDGGTNTGCPSLDQRGITRPLDGDGNGSAICDIGATEYQPGVDKIRIFLPSIKK